MKKVLVTAFKPFNNMANNYSMEVLNYIKDVEKIILDVTYDYSYQDLVSRFNLDEFDLIIAMGEARMRNVLTLEIEAKNISSCSLPDNINQIKSNEIINIAGEERIQTKVNVDNVKDIIDFSYDAGKFVCNNIYYHLLTNFPRKSLFIHIPNCNNDEMKYKEYADKINIIIERL